ncbi:MAG: class I SAM-dependent methyltransferase [Pseudomonadota bacterium]
MNNLANTETIVDFEAIKAKQQATWGSGNYAAVGSTLQLVGELLCESANLASGSEILDVAAGNGNATLAAARRFCRVTSTDYVESLLEAGKKRAQANGFSVDFRYADVENLPFAANRFDAVISTFGCMFAPNQMQTAAEMVRVCRPGGTVATANWTPDGFIGQVFRLIGRHVAPPAGVSSPARWGDEDNVREIFPEEATIGDIVRRHHVFRYCSIEHFLAYFKNYYGPILKAFEALGDDAVQLEQDLRELLISMNTATDGTLVLPSEYIEVIMEVK